MAEVLTLYNEQGEALSPFEAKTGIVLPIWAPWGSKTNRHHPHFFRSDWLDGPRKTETRAVRFSRLQRTDVDAHNKYHRIFEGTLFPRDEKQSFEMTILNCVRYIPSHAVDMSGLEPAIVEITPKMKRMLLAPGVITMERRRSYRRDIGQFLMHHAVSQKFSHVKKERVQEFIELGQPKYKNDELSQQKRYGLGMRLANIGLGLAVDGIDKFYHQARKARALPETAPTCAWQVAKGYVEGYETDYFMDLEKNLVTQFKLAA